MDGRRVRCSQAANPFVKKYYFLTVSKAARPCLGRAAAVYPTVNVSCVSMCPS